MLHFLGLKKKKKVKKVKVWKILFIIFFAISLLGSATAFIWVASLEIPSLDGFEARHVTQSTKIYDRTGKILLFDLHENIRRTIVPLDKVSRYAKNAAVAIEDAEFYEHHGIKPKSIIRAVLANLRSGSYSQGGSTITQQVIKNSLLNRKKTIKRKVKEWILAIKLEKKLTKDQILEIYLNDAPYGGTVYGIEEASQYYFATSASDLTLAQAAYIAALPQRPSYFSPYGDHLDALEKRKNLVLLKMHEKNFITDDEYKEALNETVEFSEYGDKNIKAPHFVFFVKKYLENKYGREAVYENGLKVITTLDYKLQSKSETILKRRTLENEKRFNAENAGMVAIDPHTGQILAMIGSRDYFDKEIDGKFNVATALRQPGSTFKPLVYATAFEKGFTPETVLFDLPTQFSTNCDVDDFSMQDGCYAPQNYDDKFRGPMTMKNALAQSINVPAIKTLHLAGIADSMRQARKMGISSLNKSARFYGFSLVLGGGEVSLLEMTDAYSSFANDGVMSPYTAILRVEDPAGTVLEEYTKKSRRVLSANTARQIADILSDNTARAPAYGSQSPLFFQNQDVAAKTGTTNNFKDVWIIGFTPEIVVGTWAGNNDNSPIVHKVAGFVLAPLWRELMVNALKTVPATNFREPAPTNTDLKPVLLGSWSGGDDENPNIHSILHWVDKNDPQGAIPTNPNNDAQYKFWEYSVQKWASEHGGTSTSTATSTNTINSQQGSIFNTHTHEGNRGIKIISPAKNSHQKINKLLTVALSYTPSTKLTKVEYYLNGIFIGSNTSEPFSISIVPQYGGGAVNTIKAIGYSGMTGMFSDEVSFIVD